MADVHMRGTGRVQVDLPAWTARSSHLFGEQLRDSIAEDILAIEDVTSTLSTGAFTSMSRREANALRVAELGAKA